MATGRLMSWASCGALAVWLLAGCGGGIAQAPKPAATPVAKPAEITDIQVSGTGDAVQISVVASANNVLNEPQTLLRYGSETPAYARQYQEAEFGIQLAIGLRGTF